MRSIGGWRRWLINKWGPRADKMNVQCLISNFQWPIGDRGMQKVDGRQSADDGLPSGYKGSDKRQDEKVV